MGIIEFIKAIILGIVEGITEWLPISSTGHMILVDEFLSLNTSATFKDLFFVVIQLGAILAVVVMYWKRLIPFSFKRGFKIDNEKISMWFKILVASIPAGIVGILFDDIFTALFYNYQTVAIMLIIFGILFIVIENKNKHHRPRVNSISKINYPLAFAIGVFQLIAAVFPGTSRSGATIVGALMLGVSRTVAAEFTFFLAIPAMFGASALKLVKFFMAGQVMTGGEIGILVVGMVVAFIVSIISIRLLMNYIKKNDFKVFGWYRIILGIIVLIYFAATNFIA